MIIFDYLYSKKYISQKTKSVCERFTKVFLFSGFGSMATLASFSGNTWRELGTWIGALMFSFIVGGISGVVAGYEKWANWDDTITQ